MTFASGSPTWAGIWWEDATAGCSGAQSPAESTSAADASTRSNSVFIYDYGEVNEALFYMAMEYIEGQTLAELIQPKGEEAQPLPLSRVLGLTKQICSVLDAAHQAGVVHRDLKPQNVMVSQRGDRSEQVKVVDFGIARSLTMPSLNKTAPGQVVGTPAFMSPEQANGDPNIDQRSDIFSLGLLVYHMLTGTLPLYSKGMTPVQQLIQRATMRQSLPPGTLPPQLRIPRKVEAAVLRALEPDRERRPRSAGEFYAELAA